MIPERFIEEVKARNDIYEVLSQFIHLEKKGKNAWACCPFHSEKTPSFSVNIPEQNYKCFGCGERGNVISFLMKYEKLTFIEAIEWLAARVHMAMPEIAEEPGERERKKRFDTLRAALTAAAKYYYGMLKSEDGKAYLDYWYSRGLDAQTITYFGLGAAPDSFGLINHLQKKGFDKSTILQAGLAEEKNGKISDAEHHRVIVPIIDQRGQVVGFGGRILESGGFAKYKNTTGTEIFLKSNILYNLNRLKELSTKAAILVEGYMDVIALYQAGFQNAVAPMGTSFTDEQCALLKKYADLVYVSFDGDQAGRKATLVAIEKMVKLGFEIRVVTPPDKLDPDEVIKKFGVAGFEKCLNEALPWIDYKLKMVEEAHDLTSLDGRTKYAKSAIDVLMTLDAVSRDVYVTKIVEKANVAKETLSAEIVARSANKLQTEPKNNKMIGDTSAQISMEASTTVDKSLLAAARFVLGAFLKLHNFTDLSAVQEDCFTEERHKKVFRYIEKCLEALETPKENAVYDILENDEEAKLIITAFEEIPKLKIAEHFAACVLKLQKEYADMRKKQLSLRYSETKSEEERKSILQEIQALMNKGTN